jgi:glycerol-3-phosphate dehydrogenase subunit C
MIRQVLKQGAYYSHSYQDTIGGDATLLKIPVSEKTAPSHRDTPTTLPTSLKAEFGSHHITRRKIALPEQACGGVQSAEFMLLDKSVYGKIMKDDGYFSSIDPLQRIKVAENTHDLGEYLLNLHRNSELDTGFGDLSGRVLYYPPCHQREQEIGMPYLELLALVPGMQAESLQNTFYCCGMAGIMGYKRDFHIGSLHIGSRLIGKIKEINPDRLVTDCLSCRLQFMQTTSYEILHPIEILRQAYQAH